jgi:hypothetical protein
MASLRDFRSYVAHLAIQVRPFGRHAPLAPRGPADRPARWVRFIALAVASVAILAVSYGLVANAILRTHLLRNAISGPEQSFAIHGSSSALLLDYETAYSIVPGRVHVEGLTIRGRDSAIEWRLTLDQADVDISLFDLLRRTFHATHVRASGFTMHVRPRLARASATPDVVAAQPSIAGFPDPPLLDDGPQPPRLTDAKYNLWTVHLENVDLQHVREIWIHTFRAAGDAHVHGRWLFHPQRWLDVGPATVDLNEVDLSYGDAPLAIGVWGSLGATVFPFDLRQASADEVLGHISYDGHLAGRTVIAEMLRLLAPRREVRFTQWEGPFDAHVVLDHGRLTAGTRVSTEMTDTKVEADGLAFDARIGTELGIDGDLATLDTHIAGLHVSRLGVERGRVESIAATIVSHDLQLAHAFFHDARLALDVSGAQTHDVGLWKDFLPSTSTFVLRSGTVTADGHVDGSFSDQSGRVRLRLLARRLTVERGDDQLTADVTSDAGIDASLAGGWAAGTATVSADDVSVRLGRALVSGKLAMHVVLRRAVWASRAFDLSGSGGTLRALSAKSSRAGAPILRIPSVSAVAPRLSLTPSGVNGHVSIDLPRADLVDLGLLGELLPLPTGLRFEDGVGQARLQAEVDLGSGAMRGDAEVVARGIRARVGATEVFGDLDCTVRARHAGDAKAPTDLSGSTIAIARASTGSAVASEDAWWGNIVLRDATLRTTGGVRFDAKAHLTAKDAMPATVLVSQNMGVPTWAANVFRMPVLHADAELRLAPSSFEVRSLAARGESASLRAEYAKRDGRHDGAVLMDLGWLDLGYDLAEGAGGLVIVGPERWFVRKTMAMHDASAAAKLNTEASEQLVRYAKMTPTLRRDEARALAAQCTLEMRSCDGASIENLLRTAVNPDERAVLSGLAYAPALVAAAQGGRDGTTLDPLVVGAVAEALKVGRGTHQHRSFSWGRSAPNE